MQENKQKRTFALFIVCILLMTALCGCSNGSSAARQGENGPVEKWPKNNLLELISIDTQKGTDKTTVIYEFAIAEMFFNEGHFRTLLKNSTEPIICYDGQTKCSILESNYYEEDGSFYLVLVCEGSHDITGTSIFDRSVSYYIQNDDALCLNKCLYFGRREGKPGQTYYIQDYNKETKEWDMVQEFFCETNSLEVHY